MRKICDACMGNGYRRIWKDTSETERIRVDCTMCTKQRPPEELRNLGIL